MNSGTVPVEGGNMVSFNELQTINIAANCQKNERLPPRPPRPGLTNTQPNNKELGSSDNVSNKPARSKLVATLSLSTERLLHSDTSENKCMKAIVGVICGLLFGVVLFLFLIYSFGYTDLHAAIIALIATAILCVGLALSPMCRCITALMFPNMVSNKGRAVMLSIIFGVLLNKQISNITYNSRVTGDSMSCIVELAANQAMDIQQQLSVPVQEMAESVQKQFKELKESTAAVQDVASIAYRGLKQASDEVGKANTFLENIIKNCNSQMEPVSSACRKGCIFSNICDLCNALSCNSLDGLKHEVIKIGDQTLDAINKTLEYFQVDLKVSAVINGSTGTSSNTTEIRAKVNDDISGKIKAIQITSDIVQKILSFSLLLILLQSLWYLKNYLARDGYDNVYITSQFKQFDKANAEQGGEKLLPLKNNEIGKYVDTHSYRLGLCELVHCKLGFAQVGLHFLLFLLLTLFDYALYYILALVQKYGSVDISVQGQGEFQLEVQGRGPVADFYRIMIKNINNEHSINSTFELHNCLPNPREPEAGVIPLLLILYLSAVLMVVCRGYGMRLRRKIAAYYYPSQEFARIEFLHKKIRHKRIGFLKFLRHQIMSKLKEEVVKEKLHFSTWLTFKFPLLAKLFSQREKPVCTSCGVVESRLHRVVLSKCKGVSGGMPCEAVYCPDCWEGLDAVCPLCTIVSVDLRD